MWGGEIWAHLQRFLSMLTVPIAFEPMVGHFIMMGAGDIENRDWGAGWDTAFRSRHMPNDLTSTRLRFPLAPRVGAKPSTYRSLGNT